MKKALIVALFGGLAIFFVPQAAQGGTSHRPVVANETGGSSEGGCATATEGKPDAPKQDAPGEGRSHYDKEQHDGPEVIS
jgi:hypothetical protein